jgi:hypothetical protein
MGRLKQDPVEQTAEYKAIEAELEAKIIAQIGENSGMGYCYGYWAAKREILREDYGIEWKSPRTLNPHVRFD